MAKRSSKRKRGQNSDELNSGVSASILRRQDEKQDKKRAVGFFAILCAILIPVGGLFWWYTTRGPDSITPTEQIETIDFAKFDISTSSNPKHLMAYGETLNKVYADSDLPGKISNLNQRLSLSERIFELKTDNANAETYAKLMSLDAMVRLTFLERKHNFDNPDYRKRLASLIESYLQDKEVAVRERANFSRLVLSFEDYKIAPSEENYRNAEVNLEKLLEQFPDDLAVARKAETVISGLSKQRNKTHCCNLMRLLSDKATASSVEGMRDLAIRTRSYSIFGHIDFNDLELRFRSGDKAASDEVEQLIEVAEAESAISQQFARMILSVIDQTVTTKEQAAQIGRQFQLLKEKMNDSLDVNQNRQTVEVFSAFETRLKQFGKTMNVEGMDFQGQPLPAGDYQGKVTVVFYWATTVQHGADQLSYIGYDSNFQDQGVQFVAVTGNVDVRMLQAAERKLDHVTFVDASKPSDLVQKMPVQRVPYVVVLDQDHRVIGLNIRPLELRAFLLKLVGDELPSEGQPPRDGQSGQSGENSPNG